MKPVRIEWGNLHHDEDLERLLNPHKPIGAEFARNAEKAIFEYLLAAHVNKIYIWDEYHSTESTMRYDWCFGATRPDGKACREHDFRNLVEMSDEEFEQLVRSLPPSPNEALVRRWRKEMRDDYLNEVKP